MSYSLQFTPNQTNIVWVIVAAFLVYYGFPFFKNLKKGVYMVKLGGGRSAGIKIISGTEKAVNIRKEYPGKSFTYVSPSRVVYWVLFFLILIFLCLVMTFVTIYD